MITLYGFGARFGMADPSPFVVKVLVLLKMAGEKTNLPFTLAVGDLRKAPRGKLPYIDDDGVIVSDSHLIRRYIASKYNVNFDTGLTEAQKAQGWAVERLLEDHSYWFVVQDRWLDNENFAKGPAQFFDFAPAPLRPLLRWYIRRKVRANVDGQGAGRFTESERRMLVETDVRAVAALLGDKPYLLGDEPTAADATLFAFVDGILCPHFRSHARTVTEGLDNLVAYHARMRQRFLPE